MLSGFTAATSVANRDDTTLNARRTVAAHRCHPFFCPSNPFNPYFNDVGACIAALARNGNSRSGWLEQFVKNG
jgi:hypothetical protein